MAILNETAILSELNHHMLLLGVLLIAGGIGISLATFDKYLGFTKTTICLVLALVFVFGGSFLVRHCEDPDFQVATDKKYIEATFAKGAPTAAVLQKYDVIGREGKVWYLVTKDGVKEEKRPMVRIEEGAK